MGNNNYLKLILSQTLDYGSHMLHIRLISVLKHSGPSHLAHFKVGKKCLISTPDNSSSSNQQYEYSSVGKPIGMF